MRMQKMLLKARYINLILLITPDSNLKGPDIGGGVYLDDEVIRICFY